MPSVCPMDTWQAHGVPTCTQAKQYTRTMKTAERERDYREAAVGMPVTTTQAYHTVEEWEGL